MPQYITVIRITSGYNGLLFYHAQILPYTFVLVIKFKLPRLITKNRINASQGNGKYKRLFYVVKTWQYQATWRSKFLLHTRQKYLLEESILNVPTLWKTKKSVDHLATRCEKMLGHDYTRRHNEVFRCLHLLLMNKYKFKKPNKIRTHSVQEIITNEFAEIKVDTRTKVNIMVKNDRPDTFVYDNKTGKIILIEVGITSQDNLQCVENEKKRKYDLLANELGPMYKAKTKIIAYFMTWDGVITEYHKSQIKELGATPTIEAYILSLVLKKHLRPYLWSIEKALRIGRTENESLRKQLRSCVSLILAKKCLCFKTKQAKIS